jgi:hypothetical protein
MKKNTNLLKLIIAIVLVLGISVMQHTPSAVAEIPMQQDGPANRIYIDVTYDPVTQTYSLGGFSSAELEQYGAPGFTPELWQVLASLDSITLKLENEQFNLVTDEEQLASIAWDASSRQILYGMLDAYIELGRVDLDRAEAWLDKADIEFSLRNSKELSDPLLIQLATLLQVNIDDDNGAVNVEGIPTGFGLTPEIQEMIRAANLNNIKLCWNKGVIDSEINGSTLPQLTLYEGGINVVDRAFGLSLGDLGPIFDSTFGAGIVFGEGDPVTGECLP